MIAILLGLQGGYTKHCCPFCEWDGRNTVNHYVKKDWPKRTWTIGKDNVLKKALVDPRKILPPPLHIKLGLVTQFVKQVSPQGEPFKALQEMFPTQSLAKLQAGIFDGPQIRNSCE